MREVDSILRELRERPTMYLGGRSVVRLIAFLEGYLLALSQITGNTNQLLREFQAWVRARYGISTGQGIERVLLFFSSDDQDAFDLFWQLFDEYRDSHNEAATTDSEEQTTPTPATTGSNNALSHATAEAETQARG